MMSGNVAATLVWLDTPLVASVVSSAGLSSDIYVVDKCAALSSIAFPNLTSICRMSGKNRTNSTTRDPSIVQLA